VKGGGFFFDWLYSRAPGIQCCCEAQEVHRCVLSVNTPCVANSSIFLDVMHAGCCCQQSTRVQSTSASCRLLMTATCAVADRQRFLSLTPASYLLALNSNSLTPGAAASHNPELLSMPAVRPFLKVCRVSLPALPKGAIHLSVMLNDQLSRNCCTATFVVADSLRL
jgi:hypothetical protein